jgi:hypothetical protein
LDRQARTDDVERVSAGYGGDSGQATAEESLVGVERSAWFALKELGWLVCRYETSWQTGIKHRLEYVGGFETRWQPEIKLREEDDCKQEQVRRYESK